MLLHDLARRPALLLLALIVAALVLGACGGAPTTAPASTPDPATLTPTTAPPSPEPAATFPVTLDTGGRSVTVPAQPARIVSLSPTATEMLFAIGAGEQVVAVDEQSTYPDEAPITDLSGLQVNVEAILGYDPDLVIASFDPGDLVAGLEAAGVPTIIHDAPTGLAGTYTQIEQLGAATGQVAEAATVVGQMQSDLDALVAELPPVAEPLTYYHELDPTYYTITSTTFLGELYGLLGLVNIADAADTVGSGYPQLSAEYIVEADPDLILLADTRCCQVTAASVAQRPGWADLTAVRTGGVVELDDDLASRWGPRVVDHLRTVAARIVELTAAGG